MEAKGLPERNAPQECIQAMERDGVGDEVRAGQGREKRWQRVWGHRRAGPGAGQHTDLFPDACLDGRVPATKSKTTVTSP